MQKKILSFLITFSIMVSIVAGFGQNTFATGGGGIPVPINPIRDITKSEVFLEDEVNIEYTISFNPIPVPTPPRKEIVLVIDNSGSMNTVLEGSTRLEIAKKAAENFINGLKDEKNLYISVITFNDIATEVSDYKLINDPSQRSVLLTAIGGITAQNGTNTGDALRRAYHKLYTGDVNAQKYMILLNDGEATAFTMKNSPSYNDKIGWQVIDGKWYYFSSQGKYVNNGIEEYVRDITINKDLDYKYDNSAANKYYVNWTIAGDVKGYSQTYAKKVAEKYATPLYAGKPESKIHSDFIAFSNASIEAKVKEICEAAGMTDVDDDGKLKHAKVAISADKVNEVYAGIAEEIKDPPTVSFLTFEETFPEGIQVLSTTNGVGMGTNTVDIEPTQQRKITSTLGDLSYTLNLAGTHYTVDPISFTVKIKANELGNYTFGIDELGNKTAFVSFVDQDGNLWTKYFDTSTFTISEINAPTINMSQEWGVDEKKFTLTSNSNGNLVFDGAAYAKISNAVWMNNVFGDTHSEFTIQTSVKPTTLTTNTSTNGVKNTFFAKAENGQVDNIELGIDEATNNLMVYLNTDTVSDVVTIGSGELVLNKLSNIIVSYNNGVLTAYINGNEYVNDVFNGSSVLKSSGAHLTIGTTTNGASTSFNGAINNVSIYNKEYSQDDLYAAHGRINDATLVARYNFETSNIVTDSDPDKVFEVIKLKDASGNGHDSTSVTGIEILKEIAIDQKMQYKIDGGSWIDYTPGDEILTGVTVGTVTVYARTIEYDPATGLPTGRMSNEVERTTKSGNLPGLL